MRTGPNGQQASSSFFLFGKQDGLQYDLDQTTRNSAGYRADIVRYIAVAAFFQRADIDDHVDFRRSVFSRQLSLVCLSPADRRPQRKTYYAAHFDTGTGQQARRRGDMTRIDADRIELPLRRFAAELFDIPKGRVRLKVGVVDKFCQIYFTQFMTLPSQKTAGAHYRSYYVNNIRPYPPYEHQQDSVKRSRAVLACRVPASARAKYAEDEYSVLQPKKYYHVFSLFSFCLILQILIGFRVS